MIWNPKFQVLRRAAMTIPGHSKGAEMHIFGWATNDKEPNPRMRRGK